MRRIVVIGESSRVRGFRLAGATVIEADGPRQIERGWASLPDDTVMLVLTAPAVAQLAERLAARPRLTWAVMPG